jgi:mortality factor 4-like protein 1
VGAAVSWPALGTTQNSVTNDATERRARLPALPRELIDVLVTDWKQVTRAPRHWVPLPCVPSCADILAAFAATKIGPGAAAWSDLIGGLRAYFDVALPKLLLYRQEREQYDRFVQGHSAPSAVYGAEHLLRLLSQLPNLLMYTDLEPGELSRLQAKLPDLYKFLLRGRSEFFLSAYKLREATLSARSLSRKVSKQDKVPAR